MVIMMEDMLENTPRSDMERYKRGFEDMRGEPGIDQEELESFIDTLKERIEELMPKLVK